METLTKKGTLYKKFDEVQVSDKFKKREFVIKTEETHGEKTYTDHIKFELVQDKCDLINDYEVGTELNVSFNLGGREYIKNEGDEPRYYNSVKAWKIEGIYTEQTTETNDAPPPLDETKQTENKDQGGLDDLPF